MGDNDKFNQGIQGENISAVNFIVFGKTSHTENVNTANTKIIGTKTETILSEKTCMGTFVFWAASTILITCDKKVSFPTRVTSTFSVPSVLMVPPITSSPWLLVTGRDSPVTMDSSTAELPLTTNPSVGIFSPALTIIVCPILRSRTSVLVSTPDPSATMACFASRLISLRIASDDRPRALASINRPVKWNAIIIPAIPAKE